MTRMMALGLLAKKGGSFNQMIRNLVTAMNAMNAPPSAAERHMARYSDDDDAM